MTRRIILRHAARQDLVEIIHRYLGEGTPTTARRFRARADAAFQNLAGMPGPGKAFEHDHPALAGLRFFPLSSPFKTYLVFYRPVAGGIEIVRVLHGARDIDAILAGEFGIDQADDDEE